jgi:hypothetical protein
MASKNLVQFFELDAMQKTCIQCPSVQFERGSAHRLLHRATNQVKWRRVTGA